MSNPPFKFKVGNKYIRRDGVIVECIRLHGGGATFSRTFSYGAYYFSTWNSGSRYNDNRLDNFDIISEHKLEPTTNMFDLNKPFKTADGREVKLLTTNGEGQYPIVGYISFGDGSGWGNVTAWKTNGVSMYTEKTNLVNDPPVKKTVALEYGDCNPHYIFKKYGSRCYVGYFSPSCIQLMSYKKSVQHNLEFEDLLKDGWEYSKDGGETWQLCQKEVTE